MKKRFGLTRILPFLALLLFCGAVMAGAPSTTDTQDVYWFADGQSTGGKSHLTRTGGMIVITLEAAYLVPGDAHTLWFIVFNTPDGCADYGSGEAGCGEDDIFDLVNGGLNADGVLAAGISIGNASGNVAKSNGTLEFGGRMPRSLNNDHQVLFTPYDFGAGDGTNYLLYADSEDDAEVHVIVQTHGQARGGERLREQLTYLDANCSPECADIQFSVHMPLSGATVDGQAQ